MSEHGSLSSVPANVTLAMTLRIDEKDDAGNLLATYVSSSLKDGQRIDIIVRAAQPWAPTYLLSSD